MKKTLLMIAAMGSLAAANANATVIRLDGSSTNLQEIVSGLPGGAGINVITDQQALDESWHLSGLVGVGNIVVELASFANQNRFGIYDVYNPSIRMQLFDGSASAGAQAEFTPVGFSSEFFGFYLDTPAGLWFSQQVLNADGYDHMVAFDLGPQFVFGWEDLSSSHTDKDFNDFVVLVSGVKGVSVPEPATLGLLGLGIAGMGVFRRRKQSA